LHGGPATLRPGDDTASDLGRTTFERASGRVDEAARPTGALEIQRGWIHPHDSIPRRCQTPSIAWTKATGRPLKGVQRDVEGSSKVPDTFDRSRRALRVATIRNDDAIYAGRLPRRRTLAKLCLAGGGRPGEGVGGGKRSRPGGHRAAACGARGGEDVRRPHSDAGCLVLEERDEHLRRRGAENARGGVHRCAAEGLGGGSLGGELPDQWASRRGTDHTEGGERPRPSGGQRR